MLVETGGANPGAKQKTEGAMAPLAPPRIAPDDEIVDQSFDSLLTSINPYLCYGIVLWGTVGKTQLAKLTVR